MYPSKKYFIGIISLLLCGALVWGILLVSRTLSQRKQVRETAKTLAMQGLVVARSQQGLKQLTEQDADGDGLPDWKEALWQLDPENPDTDSNGVSDGEQIKLLERDLQAKDGASAVAPMNTTDILARDIYTAVTVLQQSGQLTPENSEKLTEQVASSIYDAVPIRMYTNTDLSIIPTNDQTRAAYVTRLTSALGVIQPSDFQTLLESVTVTDPTSVDPSALARISSTYSRLVATVLAIPVPSALAQSHLELVNVLSRLSSNIDGIVNVDTDPLAGFVGVLQIQDTIDQLSTILSN